MATRSLFSTVARQAALRSSAARVSTAPTVARRFASTGSASTGGNEFIEERHHIKDHAAKSADLWRKVSMYICIPGAIVLGVYIYQIESEHIHHRDHEIEEHGGLPERTFYEYNVSSQTLSE